MDAQLNETTLKGQWWLPDQPDGALPGEITYGPMSGASLNVHGFFFKDTDNEARHRPFLLWGETIKGRAITLFDCHANVEWNMPGGRAATITTYFGVLGGHFRSADELKFKTMEARFTNLYDWAQITGKTVNLGTGDEFTVDYRQPEPIPLGQHNGITIELRFPYGYSQPSGEFHLTEGALVALEVDALTPYRALYGLLREVRHFVALGVGRAVYCTSVEAYSDEVEYELQGTPIYKKFGIILKLPKAPDDRRDPYPHEMLFALADLKPSPETILNSFFAKREKLQPATDLYFSNLYNHHRMPVRQSFLIVAHGIEAYHRAFIGGKYQSDDDYDKLKQAFEAVIPATLDPDFRQSLKKKLEYLHEFSLRKRIQDLALKFEALVKASIGDPKQFAVEVAEERNKLTHPEPLESAEAEEARLKRHWRMSQQLALILEVCFLHELGFSSDQIGTMISRGQRVQLIALNSPKSS